MPTRYRATGAVAVCAVALTLVAAACTGGGSDTTPDPPVHTPSATSSAQPSLVVAPGREEEGALPFVDTALPRSITLSLDPPPLSKNPLTRALALLEAWDDLARPAVIQVLGDDGRLRALDQVRLAWTADGAGNRRLPLSSGSLSPDGTLAAFAQRDAIVLVDLRTAKVDRLALPGFNEQVTWSAGSDRLLVVQRTGTALVTVTTGAVDHRAARTPGWGATFVTGNRWADLRDDGTVAVASGGSAPVVAAERVPHVAEWWGAAFSAGDQVARGAFSSDLVAEGVTTNHPQVIVVVDVTHPAAARFLAFDWTGRSDGCCAALGWLGAHSVLLSSDDGAGPKRVLAWDLETDVVQRVTEITGAAAVAVAGGLG